MRTLSNNILFKVDFFGVNIGTSWNILKKKIPDPRFYMSSMYIKEFAAELNIAAVYILSVFSSPYIFLS